MKPSLSFQYLQVKRAMLFRLPFLLLLLVLFFVSCKGLKTAVFDQYSYQQAVSIKVEGLSLMGDATEAYVENEEDVRVFLLELDKIVEYEKNKPDNAVSYAMWQAVANEDRNLLAGFFKRWRDKGQLSNVFIDEAKLQVSESLDLIIRYEANKNKTNETNILNFLSAN